jgi:hypothetical protein
MFQAPLRSSSGESTVSTRHLAHVTPKTSEWTKWLYSLWEMHFVVLVHLLVFGVTYARCHVDTVDSPNDELSGA